VQPQPVVLAALSRIQSDYSNLLSVARSLEKLARDEIERLSGERPNDPKAIEDNHRQRDLLSILADGFSRLAAALMEYAGDRQPLLAGQAKKIADELGAQIEIWWKKNAGEAIRWGAGISTLVAGVALLGWVGVDTTVGTTAVTAIITGQKAVGTTIRAVKKFTKRH
jgi:hypothetical protein